MSVPPLVCSTPPPPDQVDEEVYTDEFAFNYEVSLSPTHQYGASDYTLFDTPSPRDTSAEITFKSENTNNADNLKNSNLQKCDEPNLVLSLTNPSNGLKCDLEQSYTPEESNIEDLDLKLDSLQIDFENGRVSVEDTLNSTFDDFGTFLSPTEINDSHFTPKIPDIELSYAESEKESKSQGTSSEDSVSLPNDDHSDQETWDNSDKVPHNLDLNLETDINSSIFNSEQLYGKSSDLSEFPKDAIESEFQLTNDFPETVDYDVCESQLNLNTAAEKQENSTDLDEIEEVYDLSNDLPNSLAVSSSDTKDIFNENDIIQLPSEIPPVVHPNEVLESPLEQIKDDDFGDFADFNDNSSSHVPFNVDECLQNIPKESKEDGLENVDAVEIDEFEEFAAFDSVAPSENIVNTSDCISPSQAVTESVFAPFSTLENESINVKTEAKIPPDDDDDFGDFDTYDPSMQTVDNESSNFQTSAKPSDDLEINELVNTNDTEIIEILNKAVNTIYSDDAEKEEDGENPELLSSLGESWKQLKDYEAEQSYLFMWNNSASQKSLLKSLGIDSRNILFGPKWNSNMPRFAANLSVSPLQPIKQHSGTASMMEYLPEDDTAGSSDVSANNIHQSNDWQNLENFTMADNQASSYAESLLLDLEHLMATLDQMTSGQSAHFKISDLFTNACNERGEEHVMKAHSADSEKGMKSEAIQPPSILNIGRKINLPDTHIFTPTDSETPWSQTIHYDDTGTGFPNIKTMVYEESSPFDSSNVEPKLNEVNDDFDDFQSHSNFDSIDNNKIATKETNSKESHLNSSSENTLKNSIFVEMNAHTSKRIVEDLDDFGDFHSATAEESANKTQQITPAPEVLEPVKLTPTIPVVNWPEPGNVNNNVFDDFSEIPKLQNLEPSWIKTTADIHQTKSPYSQAFSSASTSFILKESKIDSVTFTDKISQDVGSIGVSKSESFEDFSDFQSVSNPPFKQNLVIPSLRETKITTHTISNNVSESVFSTPQPPIDDFDDFQSVEFNPVYTTSNSKVYTNSSTNPMKTTLEPFPVKPDNTFITANLPSDPVYTNYFSANNLSKPNLEPTPVRFEEASVNKNNSQQILQPLSLENYSQINWPDPGIDLQDLSRFNPINSIHSYSEPKESTKSNNSVSNDDDGWSEFVSIKPVPQSNMYTSPQSTVYNQATSSFINNQTAEDSEDWSDFVSGTVLPSRSSNEVKTISQNIHNSGSMPFYKNLNQTGNSNFKSVQAGVSSNITAIPQLSIVSPKVNSKNYNNHFQNL